MFGASRSQFRRKVVYSERLSHHPAVLALHRSTLQLLRYPAITVAKYSQAVGYLLPFRRATEAFASIKCKRPSSDVVAPFLINSITCIGVRDGSSDQLRGKIGDIGRSHGGSGASENVAA